MAEKPRFRRRKVFAKNLGFGVGFGYRNNTTWNALYVERGLLHLNINTVYSKVLQALG